MRAPDPNLFPKPRWATFIPNRNPVFKQHSNVGLVKTAVSTRTFLGMGFPGRIVVDNKGMHHRQRPVEEAFIYEFVNDAWHLVATIDEGTFVQDHPFWQKSVKAPKNYTIDEEELS